MVEAGEEEAGSGLGLSFVSLRVFLTVRRGKSEPDNLPSGVVECFVRVFQAFFYG